MEEPRPKGLLVPVTASIGAAALIPLLWFVMGLLVDGAADDGDDGDIGRFIDLASAVGSAMEGALFVSCWAMFVAVSRLLHARSTRVRRIAASAATLAWFAGLAALQLAIGFTFLEGGAGEP